jgi:hypothetical protein
MFTTFSQIFTRRAVTRALIGLALGLVVGGRLDASRVKDLAQVEGGRDNQLVGYGLVVGLAGDGDSSAVSTLRSVANALQRYGLALGPTDIKAKNVAAVMITAEIGAFLKPGSKIAAIYRSEAISERHRHRYEVNTAYRDRLEAKGLSFAGTSPDGLLPETVELVDHPWFIGVQYHPELKSRPFEPHPLFASFIAAAKAQSRLV